MTWWITRTAVALWPALRELALWLGRWLVRELADVGVKRLTYYLRQRVKVFRWRLENRAKTRLRRRWLTGRIHRWETAIQWLHQNRRKLGRRVSRKLCEMAETEVPDRVTPEDFERWRLVPANP